MRVVVFQKAKQQQCFAKKLYFKGPELPACQAVWLWQTNNGQPLTVRKTYRIVLSEKVIDKDMNLQFYVAALVR